MKLSGLLNARLPHTALRPSPQRKRVAGWQRRPAVQVQAAVASAPVGLQMMEWTGDTQQVQVICAV